MVAFGPARLGPASAGPPAPASFMARTGKAGGELGWVGKQAASACRCQQPLQGQQRSEDCAHEFSISIET